MALQIINENLLQPDYKIFEMNKRLQQRTDDSDNLWFVFVIVITITIGINITIIIGIKMINMKT